VLTGSSEVANISSLSCGRGGESRHNQLLYTGVVGDVAFIAACARLGSRWHVERTSKADGDVTIPTMICMPANIELPLLIQK